MINQYQIIDYTPLGIPSVEVKGNEFHYLDLFEIVGRQQFMTTFYLMEGSEARNEYGKCVLGVIYYEPQNTQKLNSDKTDGIGFEKIRINSPDFALCLTKRSELKYGGIKVTDIESIAFLPSKKKVESYDTGEKKVPNIVEVKLKDKMPDVDIMYQNHLRKRYRQGVELIQFEKEELIGITLGIYGEIDYQILNDLGFDDDSIKENLNIWKHFYKFKERRGKLTDEEKKKYNDILSIEWMSICTKILKEAIKSGSPVDELKKNQEVFKKIFESCKSFNPSILLYGKKQVYWDIEKYLHITMGHIKEYQLGKFKEKTPFPYKASDLKRLIEKVLDCVQEEYEAHISEKPNSNFTRQGSMAVVFNSDHYNLRIDPSGRLDQFYTGTKQ